MAGLCFWVSQTLTSNRRNGSSRKTTEDLQLQLEDVLESVLISNAVENYKADRMNRCNEHDRNVSPTYTTAWILTILLPIHLFRVTASVRQLEAKP